MTEIATFALGCFWSPDDYFSKLKGVESTRVGYTGGTKKNPTYHDLGDHTESVEIKFNPDVIPYKELLEHFWSQHNPGAISVTQYKSAIFYHNEEQRKKAEESKRRQQEKGDVVTEVLPAGVFYEAEEYHQKYLQKGHLIGKIYKKIC
ncbi:MAG: peptide-methionine (S)-S-oxide reductase MsrA [Candidatus Altiarchaeota archaeon]|nr:peptide-methionine (S)-S-oxide reductase MsrA [Candidatus Altiarchaeota archaeon]